MSSVPPEAWPDWEDQFAAFLRTQTNADAAHDRAHIERVVTAARRLADDADAALEVVVPAAWLHDCVTVPKDDPQRASASRLAAEAAVDFLSEAGYPQAWHDDIAHAITAHSYSGEVTPQTLEARIVQDADRLDALGAVGIARCFMVGGSLGHALYDPDDPFCEARAPDDGSYAVDHFFAKLLRLPDTMKTEAGRTEAERRAAVMRTFLDQLGIEIGTPPSAERFAPFT
ncbi:MAG: HD domain-containing protein [Salinibacter sp.]